MGFLTEGDTLPWSDAKQFAEYIRTHGIEQFLSIYFRTKERTNDALLWGDEVEYILVKLDDETKTVKLSLRAHDIIQKLDEDTNIAHLALWRPEYGRFMIEGTPGAPYGKVLWTDFREIEVNMRERRELITKALGPNEAIVTLTNFPLIGVGSFTEPAYSPGGPVAESLYTPDEIIHPHHRFATLTRNIRERRGANVAINIPVFKDTNTKPIKYDDLRAKGRDALDDHIYMDSMAFGMGMCCLQTTFQACNVFEARHFYDQLAVLSPIMLAITAGTPILRGMLADNDARWSIIAGSVDDRPLEERGLKPLENNHFVIPKSRYDSISTYISRDESLRPEYNDIDLVKDKEIYNHLRERGIDELLARHISHLFIRDPLVIYHGKIELDDEKYSDHFENIQSTNWQTVRFKPPPPQSPIGWRVEFRPMECSITDFENAAFVTFIVLLTRVITSFDINMYIPISKVDENMHRAHARDAVLTQKFFFRKVITTASSASLAGGCHKYRGENGAATTLPPVEDEYEEMTINQIMNGGNGFTGLIPLMNTYLDAVDMDIETRVLIQRYMTLVSERASGKLQTTAAWIRNFVRSHPTYQHDSVVTQEIAYDLVKKSRDIAEGKFQVPELLGNLWPLQNSN